MTIAINDFARRQTADSKFSHCVKGWNYVIGQAEKGFTSAKPGYRDGVVLVAAEDPQAFLTGITKVNADTRLETVFEARREGEQPFVSVVAKGGNKVPAKTVEIVLYRHDVLQENNEASTDAAWEVVSINAWPHEGQDLPCPITMARNFLALAGGTKANHTAEEFAQSILFWSQHAMLADRK